MTSSTTLVFQIFLSCPHTVPLLSIQDLIHLQLAIGSNIASSSSTNRLIANTCRLAFRSTLIAGKEEQIAANNNNSSSNRNSNTNNNGNNNIIAFVPLSSPLTGETYKHLWFYVDFLSNVCDHQLSLSDIYSILAFGSTNTNANSIISIKYVLYLLQLSSSDHKHQLILRALCAFAERLHFICNNAADSGNVKYKPTHRLYAIAQLIAALGEMEIACKYIDVKNLSFFTFHNYNHNPVNNNNTNSKSILKVTRVSQIFHSNYDVVCYSMNVSRMSIICMTKHM